MVWPFSSSSRGPARREPFRVRAVRWLRRLSFLLLAAGLVAGGYFATQYTRQFIYRSGYFKIREIRISGASAALEQDARAWLARQTRRFGDNLVLLNREAVRTGLAGLPRAKAVEVRKVYPQTLIVELKERRPLMAVHAGTLLLIDEEGVLIAETKPEAVRRLGLPVLTGIPDGRWRPGMRLAQPHLGEVLRAAAFLRDHDPVLGSKIVEWNLNGREEITAMLVSRTEVRFGDRSPLETLDKLSSTLRARPELEQAAYIDRRMEKQIVYK